MATPRATQKRKRVVLTINQKVEVIKMIDRGCSAAVVAAKYGIAKNTVTDIKKNKQNLLAFHRESSEMGIGRKAKTMRLGEDQKLDKAVYIWMKQKRMEGAPVTGPMLCEKAVQFSKRMHGEEAEFKGSTGWQWRFCNRHGIRSLSLEGEKLSADKEAADTFVPRFRKMVEEKQLSLDQIFNCDETGLYYRLLPQATLAMSFEKSADGRKKSKDRITINACSNASGSIKLPLQLIGKARRPRCFRGLDMQLLPVKYAGQTNAWMTTSIFSEWFHNVFVPRVRAELRSLGQECRAVLLLDNCSAHPDAEELVSADGQIFAFFLPPNVTSLIQPMDQGVLESLKRRYKKKLLHRLLLEDEVGTNIADFLKQVNMKVVVDFAAESWKEITTTTLRKSWRKIMPMKDADETSNEDVRISEFTEVLHQMIVDVLDADVCEWLQSDQADPGFQIFTEDEICGLYL